MFKEYGKISTILYEHTKPVGCSIGGDIEFYAESLKGVSGAVLEAGVGTGRVLIPLIQQGFVVDGVDLSAEMLEQCKANLQSHNVTANIYQQNLTDMSLPMKYGAVIMPAGSFCLLPRDLVGKVLDNFFEHLEHGGKVIIDLLLPTDFREGSVDVYDYPMSNGTGILFTSYSKTMDWTTQKTAYVHKYELLKDGEIQETEVSHFVLQWYGIQEFEMMLGLAGFTEINHVIGYGKDQPSPITFTAIKR
ncbi:MAG: class I SAM-dependent methyltransferase [Defluviitaleaceae bacterium]|nr:class I SAM-dependent methyltransferase [Defluviitaleaceae bacterium]